MTAIEQISHIGNLDFFALYIFMSKHLSAVPGSRLTFNLPSCLLDSCRPTLEDSQDCIPQAYLTSKFDVCMTVLIFLIYFLTSGAQ